MTTFVLHGGFTKHENETNDSFYREVTKNLPEGGTLLLAYFAGKDQDKKKEDFAYHTQQLNKAAPDKKLKFVLASENDLIWQLERANGLYLHGGDTERLMPVLKRYPEFKEKIEGKLVVGSSAGVYALSTFFYSNDKGGIHEGLGILPIRAVCHFESEIYKTDDDVVGMLDVYSADLDLITLKDYEWKEFVV